MRKGTPRSAKKRVFREGGTTLTLVHRGTHHELKIGDVPILTSALLGTERAFGRLAPRAAKKVVVGGLGFGSTLSGVLESVGRDASVIVVEKLETVVRLVRDELAHLANAATTDPRVTLVRDDVHRVIAAERNVDAILLDVDNGPDWGSFRTNARLYEVRGLRAARAALRPGGIYAVWSGYSSPEFCERLRKAGFTPSVVPLHERGSFKRVPTSERSERTEYGVTALRRDGAWRQNRALSTEYVRGRVFR
jgi:spermidine synthase